MSIRFHLSPCPALVEARQARDDAGGHATGGPDLPATIGIEPPRLAKVVFEAAAPYGTRIWMCSTITALA
jgi:hypothetical protein